MFDTCQTLNELKYMSTDFGTILDDLKSSFRVAKENIGTFFLANLGMIVLLAVMLFIIGIPFVLLTLWTGGQFWLGLATMAYMNPILIGSGILVMSIPFSVIFFTAFGSMFGLTRDVVESGEGKAESVFSWFRSHFMSFASAGIILSLIIVFPMILIGLIAVYLNGGPLIGLAAQINSVFNFVWVFITFGLTSMVFPAIVNGAGVQDAFVQSFKLSISRFDRVFGLLSSIFVITLITLLPMIAFNGMFGFHMYQYFNLLLIGVAAWSFISIILWILLIYPMALIATTRLYHEFSGLSIHVPEPAELPVM